MLKRIRKALITAVVLATGLGIFLYKATPKGDRSAYEPPVVDWDSVIDDPNQELVISWLGKGRGVEGGWIETMLEERFNVDYKPVFLTFEAFIRKKPLLFAGGQVPDVCFEPPGHVKRDAHEGLLLELPYDLIKKYAPTYLAKVNDVDPTGWIPTLYNGKNYGLPLNYVKGLYPRPGLWRMDWLRNVGIDKVPETLDEWEAALRAFRYDDPNRSGKQDTYGMSGDMATAWWRSFPDIFLAFDVLPYEWVERDGKIVWGGCLPETKEALALLRRWVEEDLIDPDFAIEPAHLVEQNFANGKTGYVDYEGRFGSFQLIYPASYLSLVKRLTPDAELAVAAFPAGPRGHRGGRIQGASGNALAFGSHLADEPEKVIRVLKMMEAFATDEQLAIDACLGKQGLHWDFVPPFHGPGRVPPYDDRYTGEREALGQLNAGSMFHPDTPHLTVLNKYKGKEARAHRDKYRRLEWARRDALGTTEFVPRSEEYLGDLRLMQQIAFTEILTGDRELDYFDTFVKDWHEQGGAILVEEANKMSELRKRIYKEVGATL